MTSGGSRPSDTGEPGHPDPEIRRARSENFFSAIRASVWSKHTGENPRTPPLDPSLTTLVILNRISPTVDPALKIRKDLFQAPPEAI